jgi:hypothetical protein
VNAQKAIKLSLRNNLTAELAAVADWADKVRYTKENHWTIPLQFVDVQNDVLDGGCPEKRFWRDDIVLF